MIHFKKYKKRCFDFKVIFELTIHIQNIER